MHKTRFKVITTSTPNVPDVPDSLFLSRNDKTGWSVNVAIAQTCHPTRACRQYCYGLTGRIALPGALARQAQNAAFFAEADPDQLSREAADIVHVVSRQQGFLRIFGVGDLQPGSVHFVNEMVTYAAKARPKFRLWLSTRKFDLAARLIPSSNLHVMLSFDYATPTKAAAQGRALLAERGPEWFAAWTRLSDDEAVPDWVSVVFEEHGAYGRRAHRMPEVRACPATVHADHGGAPHEGACARCRRCFDVDRRANRPPLVTIRRKGKDR